MQKIIQLNLERRKDSANSDSFLKKELADAKNKLENSEQKLIDFAKRESIVQLNADNKGGADSLESQTVISLNIALAEAEKDRIAANARLEQAQYMGVSKLLEDPTIQQLKINRLNYKVIIRKITNL